MRKDHPYHLRGLASNSGVLLLSSFLLKAMQIIFFPIYTRYVSPAEMGQSEAVLAVSAIVFPVLVMGLDGAFSAYYFKPDGESREAAVFQTVLWTLGGMSLLPLFGTFFARQMAEVILARADLAPLLGLAFLGVVAQLWALPFGLALRMKNQLKRYAFLQVLASFIQILVMLLCLLVFDLKEASFVLAYLAYGTASLLLFASAYRVRPQLKSFDRPLLRSLLGYGLPLFPNTMALLVLALADRYLLLHFHGEKAVGLYGVSLRLVTLLHVLLTSIGTAYTSFAFGSEGREGSKAQYRRVMQLLNFILLGLVFTGSLFVPEFMRVMTSPAYQESASPVLFLFFGQWLYAVTMIAGYGISFRKKSGYLLLASIPAALLNLGLNYLLIPQHGIWGAGFTTFLAYVLMASITVFMSKRLYPCDYGLTRIFVIGISLLLLAQYTQSYSFYVKLLPWALGIFVLCIGMRSALQEGLRLLRYFLKGGLFRG